MVSKNGGGRIAGAGVRACFSCMSCWFMVADKDPGPAASGWSLGLGGLGPVGECSPAPAPKRCARCRDSGVWHLNRACPFPS